MELTKTDIKALKNCDSICFDHLRPEKRQNGVKGQLRAIKHTTEAERQKDPFAPNERTYTIAVDSHITVPHEERKKGLGDDDLNAFEMVYHSQYTPGEANTLVDLLRPGDQVELQWWRGNNNELVTNSGLYKDELRVVVRRQLKKSVKRFRFFLSAKVGLDNTARMTRRN